MYQNFPRVAKVAPQPITSMTSKQARFGRADAKRVTSAVAVNVPPEAHGCVALHKRSPDQDCHRYQLLYLATLLQHYPVVSFWAL